MPGGGRCMGKRGGRAPNGGGGIENIPIIGGGGIVGGGIVGVAADAIGD